MLKNTFVHVLGLGIKTEQRIWSSGIHSWDDFIGGDLPRFSPTRKDFLKRSIEDSIEHLSRRNANFFGERLPSNQFWRIFPEFREFIAYLDIETTGLGSWGNKITTIALYDGKSIFTYVQGQNLDEFKEDIQRYKVLVICDQAKSKKKVLGVELWQLLNKYYQFLFLGAASPDLPYLSFKTGCVNWADVMHYETCSPTFLLRACPVVPCNRPSGRKPQSA